ncbi:hypothetical protein MMC30_000224 [Trapelia coarctata]|nr:hypothetical protein [Trapelia coarctata]
MVFFLRSEICIGYRDEATLIFRDENEKAARASVRRRASAQSFPVSETSSQASSGPRFPHKTSGGDDPSNLSATELSSLNLSSPYPWVKAVPEASAPSPEDQAVFQFFEKYVMYPCNQGSSPGFLEHLPGLLGEVKVEGKLALRSAVRAAAYASLSSEQSSNALGKKALHCYGLALSSLAESLADPHVVPDDFILMTVVVLDLFESLYLQDSVSVGSHAEGMAQILRLRGPNQIYGARGWSLFRLSHHRLQKQQLAFKQGPLPESEAWLNSFNEELLDVRVEKDAFQINKICARARDLMKRIDDTDISVNETLDMVKEMHALDQVQTTWLDSPNWAYKTIHRSEITQDRETASKFPEFVQLHHDVWIAYEWNYHRTARIIMHEHLLLCLGRLESSHRGREETLQTDLRTYKQVSIQIVQALADEVLSTVPQSLGDIDHQGNILANSSGAPKCKGIGGYFLLWPIKIIKRTQSATVEQRVTAQGVFERIRECTGMKAALGEASSI